nr:Crp/Fnr family transcriptional regulator [uncultured Prevotella sp.]
MVNKVDLDKEKIAKSITSLWENLREEHYTLLFKNLSVQHFKKNEIIYKEFESPTKAMCLIQGKVKIYKDGVGGRNQIVRVIKPVEFFGFRAYFAGEDYKTAAMAFENCVIAFFPINVLIELMTANFEIAKFFIRYLSVELGRSDDRTVNLTQKHIRGRLAEALLFLKDSYGLEEDGYTLSIYLSREDLASLSNMTTSNAIRTLSAFANEKLIAIDGRKIKFIADDKLKKISKMG